MTFRQLKTALEQMKEETLEMEVDVILHIKERPEYAKLQSVNISLGHLIVHRPVNIHLGHLIVHRPEDKRA